MIRAAWYWTSVGERDEREAPSFGEQALAHADSLYNLARYLTGSAADGEDLVQETYARALGAAASFDGRNLKAWLFKILRNAFTDSARRRKRHPEGPIDADRLRDDVAVDALRNVVAADIEAALMTLSDDARAVILLDLEGLTELEVADVLGCAVGTVKSRLSRARMLLRRQLKDYAR